MYYGLYYITSLNSALKRFTTLTRNDLIILSTLLVNNYQCSYSHLHEHVSAIGITMNYNSFGQSLQRCRDNGYIARKKALGYVVYSITIEGIKVLHSFSAELNAIVDARIKQQGNGLPS